MHKFGTLEKHSCRIGINPSLSKNKKQNKTIQNVKKTFYKGWDIKVDYCTFQIEITATNRPFPQQNYLRGTKVATINNPLMTISNN